MPTIEQINALSHLAGFYGLKVPTVPVCRGHVAPGEFLARWVYDRPPVWLVQGPRGGGKAQPLDSLIQTPTGPVRMGDIIVSDVVCTPDGKTAPVVAVHEQGVKSVFRIEFRDGDSVECSEDHLWEVSSRALGWSRPKIVTAGYILDRHLSPARHDCNFSIRLPEPLEFHQEPMDRVIRPYTMGVLLGDGCFRRGTPSFTTADPEIAESLSSECSRGVSVGYRGKYTYSIAIGKNQKNPYTADLIRMGLWDKLSQEKHIPDEYLFASVSDRWSLLQGMMDTDGTIDPRGHVSYSTSSPAMARDFKFLYESLGGICVIREKPTKCLMSYNLYLKANNPGELFRLARKKARGLPRTKYPAKRIITSVVPIGEKRCRCITIDSPDGLYLTDHCIVTHNSAIRGFATKVNSERRSNFQSAILAGSLAQSEQIYNAIRMYHRAHPDLSTIKTLNKTKAEFINGSEVSILAASSKQVRGPHVQDVCFDEIDEMDPEVRESASPMAMALNGVPASIAMTSTWHRVSGPMSQLVKTLPTSTFCVFEVLETCTEERSGPALENCPLCPIVQWCHSDRHQDPLRRPKAKRSNGHYAIDSLIAQSQMLSPRAFESDMLCGEPRAAGMWFKDFDSALHVTEKAEYDRNRPVNVSIDPGVYTGTVWFQIIQSWDGLTATVNVFGDYLGYNLSYESNALAIIAKTKELTGQGTCYATVSMDPAGKQKTAAGPVARSEYGRVGCVGRNTELMFWPHVGNGHPKADSLGLLEALMLSAGGKVHFTVHPRCKLLIDALKSYLRKKNSDGQWLDDPEDEQHPHEDLVDPIVGGISLHMPAGRRPKPRFAEVHAGLV